MRGIAAFAALFALCSSIGQQAALASQRSADHNVRVWAVNYKGTLRCAAVFPNKTLTPGRQTHVRFELTNLTDHKIRAGGIAGFRRFSDADRNVLWKTNPARYFFAPGSLGPHETKTFESFDARIRWSGPLYVRPTCHGFNAQLPERRFNVAQPTAPSSDADAIDAAVSAPGSPFQSCHPGSDGEARTGSFAPPTGRDDPDMTLRCWAEVRHEQGFDVVALNMVSPEDAPDYTLKEEAPSVGSAHSLPQEGMLAGRWGFVVTSNHTRGYLSLMQDRLLDNGRTFSYSLDKDGTWTYDGRFGCGTEGAFEDPLGRTFYLDWLPDCT